MKPGFTRRLAGAVLCVVTGLAPLAHAQTESDDIGRLLHDNATTQVGYKLEAVQSAFERGAISEYALRNAFRPFYYLDATSRKNLEAWAARDSGSYVAHLGLGLHYKTSGSDARGTESAQVTPKEKLDLMDTFYRSAEYELLTSLRLTPKPYLSLFHLLTVYAAWGDRTKADEILRQANAALPGNQLARYRYFDFLTPRWGGSYAAMDAFIANAQKTGTPDNILSGFRAIELQDKADRYELDRDIFTARELYRQALVQGNRVGGTFRDEWMRAARSELCPAQGGDPACK